MCYKIFFILAISFSRLNVGSVKVKFSGNELRDSLSGSWDFAYDGPINDGSSHVIETPLTTTVSPEFQQCVDTCLSSITITDKRPVCATDRVTYSNSGHFNCAVQCGKLGINKLYTDRCNNQF